MRAAAVPTPLPLHVEVRGAGPPIMLLHGFGGHAFTFRYWVDELARDRQVWCVDLKGFGVAPKPDDGRYGVSDQAELIYRLIVEHDLCDLTMVGHSFGGGVALVTALRLLDDGDGRLARLVSLAGMAYPQELPPYIAKVRRRWLGRLLLGAWPKRRLIRSVLRSIVHDPGAVTDEQVEAYSAPLRTRAGRAALVEAALQIIPPDAGAIVARYHELDVPTLLLWGRGDPVVPLWVAERLLGDLARARLVVLEACGHMPAEERPRESLDALLAFLGQ